MSAKHRLIASFSVLGISVDIAWVVSLNPYALKPNSQTMSIVVLGAEKRHEVTLPIHQAASFP